MKKHTFKTLNNNNIQLYKDGPEFEDKYIELIKQAKEYIYLQTYIFAVDDFGQKVLSALKEAVNKGRQVYIMLDSIGSQDFPLKDEQELKRICSFFQYFNRPSLKSLHRGIRRLHHKVLLIDGRQAFVGGINIVSAYTDKNFYYPRLDFATLLEGPIIKDLKKYSESIFLSSGASLSFPKDKYLKKMDGGYRAKISVNDWFYHRLNISREYSSMVDKAQNSITIINSYFFPRKRFMKKLIKASQRGVRVRLILPRYLDWPSYNYAVQYLYSYFLKNDVEIYEWENSILHGKMATVDGVFTTIGSFNLNYTSYQANLEINIDIDSQEFAGEVGKEIEQIIESGCKKINKEDYLSRFNPLNFFKRFLFYSILSIIAGFSISLASLENNWGKGSRYRVLRLVLACFFFLGGIAGIILPVLPGIPLLILSFMILFTPIKGLDSNED